MRTIIIVFITALCWLTGHTQHKDTVLWAFPITDYSVKLNDSTTIVQVVLPANLHFTAGRQLGLLRGIYRNNSEDTGRKGWGKCQLIKGVYNYFAIHADAGKNPRKDDLVYTFIAAPANSYQSPLFYCAGHNITFVSVTDTAFYKPRYFFAKRTQQQDENILDKMLEDIQYTGRYFLANDSSMNKLIEEGAFKGGHILNEMVTAKKESLVQFLRYVAARSVKYAGNTWKVSETYATWVISGAPTVVEE